MTPMGTLADRQVIVVQLSATSLRDEPVAANLYDGSAELIGSIRRAKQSARQRVFGWFRDHSYEVLNEHGVVEFSLTRPPNYNLPPLTVADGAGNELGEIEVRRTIGNVVFGLSAGGQQIGELLVEAKMWSRVSVSDADGNEVARISTSFTGELEDRFNSRDSYLVTLDQSLTDPLGALVIVSTVFYGMVLRPFTEDFWGGELFRLIFDGL